MKDLERWIKWRWQVGRGGCRGNKKKGLVSRVKESYGGWSRKDLAVASRRELGALVGTRKQKTTYYSRIVGTRKQKPLNHKIGLSVIG
jgi:hypothetical protein